MDHFTSERRDQRHGLSFAVSDLDLQHFVYDFASFRIHLDRPLYAACFLDLFWDRKARHTMDRVKVSLCRSVFIDDLRGWESRAAFVHDDRRPLYQTYPVLFDMAGTVVVFMVIPVLVEKVKHGQVSWKETLCKILKNPFILAVIFGLLMNVCGLHLVLEKSSWLSLYNNLIDMATKPIVSIILFTIGYEMNITKETLVPILKLFSIRIILYLLIIVGFFLLFPYRMKEKAFCLAVLLYFMCPTSFALPMQLGPICTKKEQEFMSTFISIFMFITMIVYTCLVLFLV